MEEALLNTLYDQGSSKKTPKNQPSNSKGNRGASVQA